MAMAMALAMRHIESSIGFRTHPSMAPQSGSVELAAPSLKRSSLVLHLAEDHVEAPEVQMHKRKRAMPPPPPPPLPPLQKSSWSTTPGMSPTVSPTSSPES